jgi:outer membrane protein assembly factor BamA
MHRFLALALFLCALSAQAQQGLPSFEELEAQGAVIGEIRVDTHNIFDLSDPNESGFFYRAANALHIKTRPWFIRSYLLFKSGDHVTVRLIEETERLIRQNSTVYDVEIVPIRYENGVVDVEVQTRDTWTLQPGIRVRRAGGKNTGAFNIKESNLAGTGTTLGIEHASSVDRTGNILTLQHDHLLDGWTSVALQRASYDDGYNNSLSITRPFYALDTRWSAGASVNRFSQFDPFYIAGNNVAQYRHDGQSTSIFGGYSPGLINGWTRRYTVGINHQTDEYAFDPSKPPPPQLPPDRTLAGPFMRYEVIQDDYLSVMNRDLIQRPEYLTMGFQSSVQVGRSLAAFGSTDEPWQVSANVSKGFRLAQPGHQLLATANYSALYGSTIANTQAMGGSVRYFAPQKGPLLAYFAASTDHVHSPNQADDLLLGGDNGLRGYPLRYQRGQHRMLFTAEERYYTDWYPLRLFRVGAAVFFDVGRAWGGETPNPVNGWLSDMGIGLRFLNARASFGNILHVDLAFPLNRGDQTIKSHQLIVQTGKTF